VECLPQLRHCAAAFEELSPEERSRLVVSPTLAGEPPALEAEGLADGETTLIAEVEPAASESAGSEEGTQSSADVEVSPRQPVEDEAPTETTSPSSEV
jgi:hypothetical protein